MSLLILSYVCSFQEHSSEDIHVDKVCLGSLYRNVHMDDKELVKIDF